MKIKIPKIEIIDISLSDIEIISDEINDIFNQLNNYLISNSYSGENKIIQKGHWIFQISTVEDQKNTDNINVSSIDLGECQNILKKQYNILYNDSILIIKVDFKSEDSDLTYVQYELFHPINKTRLNLDYCSDYEIYINVPVNLIEDILELYDNLDLSGYNLFDKNDYFYNDICSSYTTENGTDILLKDRLKDIYNKYGNLSICQNGCLIQSYNKTNKKAKCDCEIQNKDTELNITKIITYIKTENISNILFETISNSNLKVLKCYKKAFDINGLFKNIGRIIMTIIFITVIILMIIYFIKDRKRIIIYINEILNNKITISNKKDKKKLSKNFQTEIIPSKKIKLHKKLDTINNDKEKNKGKEKHKEKLKDKIKKSKNNKNHNKNVPPKKIDKKNSEKRIKFINRKESDNKVTKYSISNSNRLLSCENNHNNYNKNKLKIIEINKFINKKKIKKSSQSLDKNKLYTKKIKETLNKEIAIKKENNAISNNMNDQELNSLKYEQAILYDKRAYLQYYWSLLKKKQLILFTFYPQNDYNLLTLKISLFLLSFSLYFTVNGFFFSDDTMHKIYEDRGVYNIVFQIPQILYSSIISTVINMILKLLSLSEKNILIIKKEKDLNNAKNQSKKIKNCIYIKFILFFILSFIFLVFFWYFISCFCAVYTNTQIILIKDTLLSFAISMIYPFGINLIPGLFRIPAIRAQKKDKKFLYQISSIVALI